MNALLIALIVLTSLTLITLAWVVIGLLVALRQTLPELRRQVGDLNAKMDTLKQQALQVMEETVHTLQSATHTLQQAERTMREAAETMENLHIITDNIRHKLEVADAIGAKVRRLPERTARLLGRLVHQGFKLGGQLVSSQIEKRLQGKRLTVYESARGLESHAEPARTSESAAHIEQAVHGQDARATAIHGQDARATAQSLGVLPEHGSEDAVAPAVGADSPVRATSEEHADMTVRATSEERTDTTVRATDANSATQTAEGVPTGETSPHTTHKEG